jgi:polar amino acid transport system substrate-binding protein
MQFIGYILIIFFFLSPSLKAADPYVRAKVPNVSIAVDHAPPYSQISPDGEISGAIVDIVRAMQTQLDFKIELVGCPFSRCIRMLEYGEVDAMGGLILTPERQQKMVFIEPAYMALSSSFVFYARHKSQLKIANYEDLYGKKIAVMRGAAYFKRFNEDNDLIKVPVPSEQTAMDLLFKERADLVIAVEETADHAMSVLNQPSNKLVKMDYRYKDTIFGYLAFNKNFASSVIAQALTLQMQQMAKSGQLSQLVAPYKLPPIPPEVLDF